MDESLRTAARVGNVSDLYRLIQEDGNVLTHVDEVEFADTLLHIAADEGCIDFAMEIMSLKPSFARKLNQEGLSPIHLAVGKGHKELVLLLMGNAKDLVRVKGRKGETPLHYVITREVNPELLPRFLEHCPECIRDMTTENQTASHIAARNNKLEALKLLCQMLKKADYCHDMVNQKDRHGDTTLHIAAHANRHEMLKLLLNCKADKHMTNQAGLTALDVAKQHDNRESINILCGCSIARVSTLYYKLQKEIVKYVTKVSLLVFQDMDNISSEDRNALLVILGLLLTTTFQACLSPPGGVWQDDGSSNSNSTIGNDRKKSGKSVMDQVNFLYFYIPTYAVFIVTFFLTLGLLKPFPQGFRTSLQALLAFLAISFNISISLIAPTIFIAKVIDIFSVLFFVLMVFMCIAYRVSKVNVFILICWLFPKYLFKDLIIGNLIFGFLLVLFLYDDEFWKGTFLLLGCSFFIRLSDVDFRIDDSSNIHCSVGAQAFLKPIFLVLGCWLFLSLCRFCIKQYNERCNV